MNVNQFSNLAVIFIAILTAFFIALWIGVVFWVMRDIRSRTRDPLMIILSGLVAFILPVLGVVIYLLLRPAKTIEATYLNALEEETLIQEIERRPKCPGCGREIRAEWILCPSCHTKIKKRCVECNSVIDLPWTLCPYCGAPQQKHTKNEIR